MKNPNGILTALDVRSDEDVIVLGRGEYPEDWVLLGAGVHEDVVGPHSVVLVDRTFLPRQSIASIVSAAPRMLAFLTDGSTDGVAYEKQVRRLMTAMYPWAELYRFSTEDGILLAIWTAPGQSVYDRDSVIDMRPQVQA